MNRFAGLPLSLIHRGGEFFLLVGTEQCGLDGRCDGRALLLLGRQNVRRALGAGEQILAVLGVEEGAQRLDAADDGEEVAALRRNHGVNDVVAHAVVAQMDLEAILKKRAQVVTD